MNDVENGKYLLPAGDEPIIELDREYSYIRFINCDGRLDKDKVIINNPIYSNTFAAFEVW